MTTEQKAKAYDEALEKAKKLQKTCDSQAVVGWCEFLFPELKKNDERIRKYLLKLADRCPEDSIDFMGEVKKEDVIAWLEKQGEKPTIRERYARIKDSEWFKNTHEGMSVSEENIEQKPKFHEGEWVTNGDYTWKIVEVMPLDYILQSQDGNIVDDTISHTDEQFHLWTIKDAKDGDVLYSPCCKLIWIYKDEKTCYVGNNNNYHSGAVFTNAPICIPTDACPATKEQRNLLFKKMHEAGYEWDAEKKELKKIEKKPAWSEEDEYTLKGIVDEIEANKNSAPDYDIETYDRFLNWLKSLKDKVQPQPKQEWSDVDERHCQMLQKIICESYITASLANKLSDWLISLKQRIGG